MMAGLGFMAGMTCIAIGSRFDNDAFTCVGAYFLLIAVYYLV